MSILAVNLNQLYQVQLQNLAYYGSQQWYTFNIADAFNAGFNGADYNSGACNGGWKAAQFMQYPYVQKSAGSIEVDNTGSTVNHNACIYQDT